MGKWLTQRSGYVVAVVIASMFILLMLAGAPYLWSVWQANYEEPTAFYSSFEPAAAIFGGAAFVAIIMTLLLQRDELQLQREELRETRDVMKSQKDELRRNADSSARQTFEATFFQLARLLNDVRDSVQQPRDGGDRISGRDAMVRWTAELRSHFAAPVEVQRLAMAAHYERFYALHSAPDKLGHYFRTVYVVLKFIHDSPVPDKKTYSRIIRAQMSNNELVMLFYNALSDYGARRMLPLIEEFDIFDNLPTAQLSRSEHAALVKSSFADRPRESQPAEPAT